MNNFKELIKYQRNHSAIHNRQERNLRESTGNFNLTDDPSCIACNPPPTEIPQPFLNFFEWAQKVLGALLYTSKSVEAFQTAVAVELTGTREIYYKQTLNTLRYKNTPIPTFERAVTYCIRAQAETDYFQKKFRGDLLTYLNPSRNPSPFRMTGPTKKTASGSNDASKSAEENLSSLQGMYPPDETIIANTTPSGKDTSSRTLSFDETTFSSYGGTGKPPKLTYKESSDEEGTSDQKDTSLSQTSKSKHRDGHSPDKRSKEKGISRRSDHRRSSHYDSSSPSSSSSDSENDDSEDDDKDPFDTNNAKNNEERNFFQIMKGLQTVFKNVGFGGTREARFVDLPTFKGGDQDPSDWLERYNHACEANGISDKRRLTLVPSFMKGSALTWFNKIKFEKDLRYWDNDSDRQHKHRSFVYHFLKHYCTTHRRTQWRSALRRCKQRPGQSVEEYAAEVESLYLKLDPKHNTPEDEKIEQFLQGLRPEFHTALAAAAPRDLEETVDRARSIEAVLSRDTTLSGYSLSKAYLNQSEEPNEEKQPANMQQLIDENNKKLIKEFKHLLSNTTAAPKSTNDRTSNNWRERPNNNTSGTNGRNCFNCGKIGHLSRDCRAPKTTRNNNDKCHICKQFGHFAKNCTTQPKTPCPNCKQHGHWGYLCPAKNRFGTNGGQHAALSYHNPMMPNNQNTYTPPMGTLPPQPTYVTSTPVYPPHPHLNY